MLKSSCNENIENKYSGLDAPRCEAGLAPIPRKNMLKNYKIYKSGIHHLFLKKRRIKTMSVLEMKWGREINFSKFKKVARNIKYVDSFKMEYGMGKNLTSFYSFMVLRCRKLSLNKFGFMQPSQLLILCRKIRLFKDLQALSLTGVPPIRGDSKFQLNLLSQTLQTLSNLKVLTFLGQEISGMYPWPLFFKKTKLEYFNITVSYFPAQTSIKFPDMKLLKNFQIEIRDDDFSEESINQLEEWLRSVQEVKKGLISVSGSSMKFDIAPYIKYPFLEFNFKLNGRFSDIERSLQGMQKIDLPISINWSVTPNETLDFNRTVSILKEISDFPSIKGFKESFQFQDNVSELSNCFPIWASVITHYSFQKVSTLQLAVPVSEENIETAISILSLSLPNMFNLEDLSITLNQEKSQEIKWYIQNSITEFITKLQKMERLKIFEFNSEPDIMINYLNDFLIALTKMTQLTTLKSEWFQISPKSFKTFCAKLKSMKQLANLELHVYTILEFKKEDLIECYSYMDSAFSSMTNLQKIYITADSNSFPDNLPWRECQNMLRKSHPSKCVDIGVGILEI